ncbi:hypothetical protein MD484_g6007, partial [Candolleomyces efflorescens]
MPSGSKSKSCCEDCGKPFANPLYLDLHLRKCPQSKRDFEALAESSKEFWISMKRRRLEATLHAASRPIDSESNRESSPTPQAIVTVAPPAEALGSTDIDMEDLDIPVAQRRGRRTRRLPKRYREDPLPQPPPPIQENDTPCGIERESNLTFADDPNPIMSTTSIVAHPLRSFKTTRNTFGVIRTYSIPLGARITHDPDRFVTLRDLTDLPDKPSVVPPMMTACDLIPQSSVGQLYGPFSSRSAFDLAEWYWNSGTKSLLDLQKLMSIFRQPHFSLSDVVDVNWKRVFNSLGANKEDLPDDEGSWIEDDGWKTTPISIDVPFHNRMNGSGTERRPIGSFRHRSIVSVIKEKLSKLEDSRHFHYHPYRASWKATETSPEVDLYGELYASQAFRDAHETLQSIPLPAEMDTDVERVVVALMIWSDATHLTTFSNATLWPCYMFFGNESKYRRCQPSQRLSHQIAYFSKLPDSFRDYLKERNGGKMPSEALLTHLSREFFHAQWSALLDEDLFHAMNDLRSENDRFKLVEEARTEIFTHGYAVDGDKIESILENLSLVPTTNSFSALPPSLHVSDIFGTLVVDLLHEFEIGVWKRLFTHLLRLLDAFTKKANKTLQAELDLRYRATPSFGRDTIRKFGLNASEMKRKAARDFEDLLQCSIPAFDSLLPEPHNENLMTLLYICAQWHALAKLRLHSSLTLDFLDYTTTYLGAQMRRFERDTCSKVPTKELPKEAEARARRESRKAQHGKGKASESTSRRPASLGVFTIKFHFLGDYVSTIRRFGTSDSYSTETGELTHRIPKSWYPRTDKKGFETQMAQIERRQARLSRIREEIESESKSLQNKPYQGGIDAGEPRSDCRYVIGRNQNHSEDLGAAFTNSSSGLSADKYLIDFIPKLKQHLLPRIIRQLGFEPDTVDPSHWRSVVVEHDRLYTHRLMRINYTTYDVRRDEDVIHMNTPQCNVMLLNGDLSSESTSSTHPYLYARVLGIFHANVSFLGVLPDGKRRYTSKRLEFLWVHWYEMIEEAVEFKLDRLKHSSLESFDAVSFVDPADVIRGIHLIPQFSLGKEEVRAPPSRWVNKTMEIWKAYFVNRFVDRDMFMRYQYGMAVGHVYSHKAPFPPPVVPLIPSNFDHCTEEPDVPSNPNPDAEQQSLIDNRTFPLANLAGSPPDHPAEGSNSQNSNPNAEIHQLRLGPGSGASAAVMIMPSRPLGATDPQAPEPSFTALKSDEPATSGTDEVNEDSDSESDVDDREYIDDLEDREVIAYEEMYGDIL